MSLKSFFSNQTIDLSFKRGSLSMRKAEDGDYYLMCQYSNRWRDRDLWSAPHKGGEILTREAHERYMRWLDENPNKAPELWSLHVPGTQRKNLAHWWGFDGNFAYAEFKLTEEEALGIKRFATVYEPGISHGFFVLKYDFDEALIEEYITYEISILPNEMAANKWTTFELVQKELITNMYLRDEQRSALVALHGEDFVKELEAKSQELGGMLDKVGIDSKALKTAVQEDVDERMGKSTDAAQDEATEDQSGNVTLDALTALQEDIMGALQRLTETMQGDIKALVTKVADLEERLDEYEDDEDDRIEAKAAAAPKSIFAGWMPGSVIGAEENAVDGRSALAKSQPTIEPANGHLLNGLFGSIRTGGQK